MLVLTRAAALILSACTLCTCFGDGVTFPGQELLLGAAHLCVGTCISHDTSAPIELQQALASTLHFSSQKTHDKVLLS